MLNEDGCKCGGFLGIGARRYRPVMVNWIGLFDAVERVYAPGRLLPGDQGFPSALPSNVKSFAHATKTKTDGFQQGTVLKTTYYGINERAFDRYDGTTTTHSDIGESGKQSNNASYEWIKNQAIAAGVDF